jgi:hypothetical protein
MNEFSLPVVPLTITVSLCLVFTFVVFFLRENTRRFSNAERESLLPLAEETPRIAGPARSAVVADHGQENVDECGGRSGRPDPGPGCLKDPAAPSLR